MQVLPQPQVSLGGLDRGVPQRNLDLLERRAALVGELGEGSAQIMRRDPDADPVTVNGDGLEDRLRPERTGPTRPAFETRRSTDPESMPAAPAQPSSAALAQDGIGTVRTRPCLPTRSTIAQRPSRWAMASKLQARELAAAEARAHEQPQQDAAAQAFRRCRVGGFEELLDLRQVSQLPHRTPERRAPGRRMATAVFGDASRSFEAASTGELAQAAERQVDRGRRQRAVDQMRAVALQRGPGRTLRRRHVAGTSEKTHRAPGDRRGGSARSRARRAPARTSAAGAAEIGVSAYGRVAHRQMAAGSCIWRGRPGCCSAHSFPSRSGTQRSTARSRCQPRMAGPAEGDQGRGAISGGAVVDDERPAGPADAAGVVVAGEDPFPAPAEAGAGAPAAVVAGLAEPAAVELG